MRLNIFIIILVVLCTNVVAQNNKGIHICQQELLGKSFISDGQDHQTLLVSNRITKFNIIFYPKFRYKLVVCSNNKQLPIDIRISDTNGSVFYANADKNYIRQWELQYSSIMNAIVELKIADPGIKKENVQLLIGYQPL